MSIVYNGFHKVEKFDVEIKGEKRTVERLGVRSAVAAIVRDGEGKVALVKQYRPCVNEYLYEIPAGLLDKDLSLEETLIQELEEECEINRANIVHISENPVNYYILCGSSNAEMNILMVQLNSIEQSREVSDLDVEKVEWVSLEDFRKLVDTGLIRDAKTLMAYFHLREIISIYQKEDYQE